MSWSAPQPNPWEADATATPHDSFEDLLSEVRRQEEWARIEDRLDLAIRNQKAQPDVP